MTIVFTSAANRDLEQIVDYLNEQGESASLFLRDVEDATSHLSRWPDTGTWRKDLSSDVQVRCWLMELHRIVYVRGANRLTILAVMHAARDLRGVVQSRLGALPDD